MKLPGFFMLILCTFAVLSCEKERVVEPIRHPTREIDLNNDQISDIRIYYTAYTWDGIGPNGTGMGVDGYLTPINNTRILTGEVEGSLFNKGSLLVRYQMDLPYFWTSGTNHLVGIKTERNRYINHWTILAPEDKEYWYMGFMIENGLTNIVGWMKVRLDSYNGLITIEETKSVQNGEITVGNQ